jgi:hypothetical protein
MWVLRVFHCRAEPSYSPIIRGNRQGYRRQGLDFGDPASLLSQIIMEASMPRHLWGHILCMIIFEIIHSFMVDRGTDRRRPTHAFPVLRNSLHSATSVSRLCIFCSVLPIFSNTQILLASTASAGLTGVADPDRGFADVGSSNMGHLQGVAR